MKREAKKIVCGSIGVIFLSFLVLFFIHLLFKLPAPCNFFIPNWDAKDVLEYYGVILGITVTVVSLIYSNYSAKKQQIEVQRFQINQNLKNKVNDICIDILKEFSFPKINIAVDNLLAKRGRLNKFLIQEEFNTTFFELEILWSALQYYFPNDKEKLKNVGKILLHRLDAISKLEKVFLDGCSVTATGQNLSNINEDKVQEYIQECFTYIVENTKKLTEELKLINEQIGV